MGMTRPGPATETRGNDTIDAPGGAIVFCDGDFRITHANANACDTFGATAEGLVGRQISGFFDEEDASEVLDVSASKATPRLLKRPDGSTFWAVVACASSGATWSVQIFDIESLIENRDALAYRESTWRLAIESTKHGVWDYDGVTGERFYSLAWKRLRGIADDAEIADTIEAWEARVHPDDLENVRHNVEAYNSGRVPTFSFSYRERRTDGEWIWILSCGRAVEWDDNGVPTRLTGTDTDITDLKQSEESVAALSRRLELALTTSGVGVWEINLATGTFSCDQCLADLYDFADGAGEAYPLDVWKSAVHPDDVEDAYHKAEMAMAAGSTLQNTYRVVWRDGQVRYIETNGVFYVRQDGTPIFLGVDRDVTDVQLHAEAISAQSMRFEAALENMGQGLSMFDNEGKLIVANRHYADLYGFPTSLLTPGTPARDISGYLKDAGTLEAEILDTATEQALNTRDVSQPFERTWRLANGKIIYYTTTPLSAGGWVSIHRDVTAKYLAEQQLAESEERFRDFTTTASDWCWETDKDGRVTYLTQSFERETGIDPAELVGRNPADISVHPDDRETLLTLFSFPERSRRDGFKHVLMRKPKPDGTLAHLSLSGMPKFDQKGAFLGFRGTGTDVSAAEERREELAEAEALLKRRSEQLIEAQQIGKIGDWSFALGDDTLWWAPETYALLRHDPETFVPTYDAVMAVYLEGGDKRVLESQALVVRSGGTRSVDVKARRADGSTGDYVVTSKARTNENGDIVGFYGTIQDITERKQAEEQLEQLAYFDPLTGLANRALFQREGDEILRRSAKSGSRGGLLLLDLDRFKEVNDSLGHGAGDELLSKIARTLAGTVEQQHFLARLGGDEFAIIVPEASRSELESFAGRINTQLDMLLKLERGEVNVSTSIGIAIVPDDGNGLTELLRNADLALYQAKENGRNRFEFFRAELNEVVQHKISLSRDLRRAITDNIGLAVHYQPQVDLASGRVSGFEALMRWKHPERGNIPPSEFIPIAESSHLICDIGIWILRSAAQQAAEWLAAGEPARQISVNVSAAQIWHSDLVSDVAQVLRETRLPPSLLCLELTETLLADHAEGRVRKVLKDLSDLGVVLALDDFGTGYSSLGYLKQLPFTKLKIDRVFVDGADTSDRSKELLKGIVALGRGLSMTVVAEGAERQEELELVAEVGCDQVQGYVCARPTPPAQALAFARDRESDAGGTPGYVDKRRRASA